MKTILVANSFLHALFLSSPRTITAPQLPLLTAMHVNLDIKKCLVIISMQVGTNGIISFGEEYTHFDASLFPTTLAASYYSYVVAPYWADVDNRADGRIYWEIHTSQGEAVSQQLITRVNDFIFNETTVSLGGTWMMVTTWEDVYPWPHGSNPDDPNLQSVSTFCTHS